MMTMWLHFRGFIFISVIVYFLLSSAYAIRSLPKIWTSYDGVLQFKEAPKYSSSNGANCNASSKNGLSPVCDPSFVHIAMTLDSKYLRGSIAAVNSILKSCSCPEIIFFHFIASATKTPKPEELTQIVKSTFPYLNFKIYPFDEGLVKRLISSSVRQALDDPLNYARNYLSEILEPCVQRVIYLDSDIILVDDIQKLWSISLSGSRVIGAPEFCHADFIRYFTDEFWSDPNLSKVFKGKKPCYFNTGVMVMDLVRWRRGNYRQRIEKWMEIQKERRIYGLGSQPPFLLVFGGDVEAIDHRWNQHGLGGENVVNNCRSLHPGPISLLHWSGKGKPWERLDAGEPCSVDYLWAPYDLYRRPFGSGSGSDQHDALPSQPAVEII